MPIHNQIATPPEIGLARKITAQITAAINKRIEKIVQIGECTAMTNDSQIAFIHATTIQIPIKNINTEVKTAGDNVNIQIPHISSIIPIAKAQPQFQPNATFVKPSMTFRNPDAQIHPAKIYAKTSREDVGEHRHQMPRPKLMSPVIIGSHESLLRPVCNLIIGFIVL